MNERPDRANEGYENRDDRSDRDNRDDRDDRDDREALVVVDVQRGFDDPAWGERNNPEAEARIGVLLDAWRDRGRPIVHLFHDSTEPDSPLQPDRSGNAFKSVAEPQAGEPVIRKRTNSGFVDTDLEDRLREGDVGRIVLCGLTTDHCVSTTARTAANLGFEVVVVRDATATFDREGPGDVRLSARESHDAALCRLHGEFATIRDAATLC
jgi:nicotinamidase-related amidase